MKKDFESSFLHNPHGAPNFCHSATILAAGSGDLYASWYCYPQEEVKDARLALARKPRGHAEWSRPHVIKETDGPSPANPVIFEGDEGELHLLYVVVAGSWWDRAKLYHTRSKDHGHTWSAPRMVGKTLGMMVRHAPVRSKDGSFLVPAYDEAKKEAVVLKSSSPFDQWEELYRVKGVDLIQPVMTRSDQGLGLFLRPCGETNRYVWRCFSSNEGRTWSDPIRTAIPNPLSGIAAFARGGEIAVVHNPTERNRWPLSLAMTSNGGVSWTKPAAIDTSDFEVSYPAFTTDAHGRVHGVYTYNRRMIKYVAFDWNWAEEQTRE